MFIGYQHLERFGTTEVAQIELGECYVFPKIDGTNASLWFRDENLQAGSRNRHLTLEKDNAGFFAWALEQPNLLEYFKCFPNHRLFGEWLVPHSLKTYRQNAWRRFYVFDVAIDKEESDLLHEGDSRLNYLHYEIYKPGLDEFGIDYIPPISKIRNANYEQLVDQLSKNVFLVDDGKGVGEGIVIKNYAFRNKYNRQTWAKIITSEFKEQHAKVMGASSLEGKRLVEEEIVEKYVTVALCEKVLAKIELEAQGWSSKMIPRLLNTVFYDLVRENSWEFIKEHKNPSINFSTLHHLTIMKVKSSLPHLF
ncbi:RNA ligase family protein [Spirosoma foliorum]|uniref:RNA ligase domain-containing protein n=1 Tax=Spirosoma foliorum TaxID=2710596 RepID=A0A7G5H2F7_9BACT|nr:RNA ligase family protein [Spirosoma foliorum]QMW05299.1 hypothetical protein H3H32_10640 [Spirosoma foliorum]